MPVCPVDAEFQNRLGILRAEFGLNIVGRYIY